jgi:hypothetical protein
MPFFRITPASFNGISATLTHGKSSCTTSPQAPITTQCGAKKNSTTSPYGFSSKQSTGAIDTKNYVSLNSVTSPPLGSTSKTDVINLDFSTRKYSPLLPISNTMLSHHGTYLQDQSVGKPCLARCHSGTCCNVKSYNHSADHPHFHRE